MGKSQPMFNMESNSKCSSTNQDFVNFTQNTTLHGINHVTDTNSRLLRRILWFASFLFTTVLFTFFLSRGLIQYFSYPTVASFQYRPVTSLDFPSVTVCNVNMLRKSFMEQLGIPLQPFDKFIHGQLDSSSGGASVNNILQTMSNYNLEDIARAAAT